MGLAALLLVFASTAFAVDLPQFDVKAHCALVGARGCQEAERTARAAVEARWDNIPEQRRHFCVQTETFQPRPRRSYVTLAECLADDKTTS